MFAENWLFRGSTSVSDVIVMSYVRCLYLFWYVWKEVVNSQGLNKAGPRANGPQNCMRALKINTWRALRARRFLGNSKTVICFISEKRNSWPLQDCEGSQKYNIKGPNDPL